MKEFDSLLKCTSRFKTEWWITCKFKKLYVHFIWQGMYTTYTSRSLSAGGACVTSDLIGGEHFCDMGKHLVGNISKVADLNQKLERPFTMEL